MLSTLRWFGLNFWRIRLLLNSCNISSFPSDIREGACMWTENVELSAERIANFIEIHPATILLLCCSCCSFDIPTPTVHFLKTFSPDFRRLDADLTKLEGLLYEHSLTMCYFSFPLRPRRVCVHHPRQVPSCRWSRLSIWLFIRFSCLKERNCVLRVLPRAVQEFHFESACSGFKLNSYGVQK